ncbi:hypothetical protein [Gluconacetobacter sp.]|uniref:hypothetical protein n=1 Tax=Gluconacetobacter sp. TaxID=1935994 RepID=UPI0039EA2B0E
MKEEVDRVAELRRMLRGYRKMTAALRRRLRAFGFDVVETKKHVRLLPLENPKAAIIIPSSASDSRGGRNAASVVARRLRSSGHS